MINPREKSVEADVVGPAYSFNQPTMSGIDEPEVVRAMRQGWDAATMVWTQSMDRVLRAPFSFTNLMWGRPDETEKPSLGAWTPDFSVTRQDGAVKVSAMLPGATQEDVDVQILDGKLVISGHCNFSGGEGASDHFSESIDLMNAVDSQRVEARIDDEGFLEVTLKLHQDTAH